MLFANTPPPKKCLNFGRLCVDNLKQMRTLRRKYEFGRQYVKYVSDRMTPSIATSVVVDVQNTVLKVRMSRNVDR